MFLGFEFIVSAPGLWAAKPCFPGEIRQLADGRAAIQSSSRNRWSFPSRSNQIRVSCSLRIARVRRA
jgi:hypothetical protein